MSTTRPTSDGEEFDLTTLAADDRLLDALGRGEAADPTDDLAVMLAAWRAELATGDPGGLPDADLIEASGQSADTPSEHAEPPARRPGIRRFWPGYRVVLSAAAVLVVLVGIGVRQADPTSPFWPLTQVVTPERADVRAAEHAIALARDAVMAGRVQDAQRFLDDADRYVARIDDSETVGRLRSEIDQLRAGLSSADQEDSREPVEKPAPVQPSPVDEKQPSTVPATPGGPSQTAEPTPAPQQPSPVIELPILPLPPLPLPLPSLPPLPLPLLPGLTGSQLPVRQLTFGPDLVTL